MTACKWCGDVTTEKGVSGFCKGTWCNHNHKRELARNRCTFKRAVARKAKVAAGLDKMVCAQCGKVERKPVRGRRIFCLSCSQRRHENGQHGKTRAA